ncbi:kinase-like protein [Aspergillus steynii IBT 23096]|uniref:Kinase-like protein n=1 Tax=Aspergillus steynii IBT 23096 TaxID=1392250 RepID=A0A2I2FZG2_9EURO|nr:kinase-like protein [Aspergillus steynii IBT 23096]PLB46017.1 kinase-like protein [Aspergillus steynii IBT 23096]
MSIRINEWAEEEAYVAIKICVSEQKSDSKQRELHVLEKLTPTHLGSRHVMRILDHFSLNGPNGTHRCLVLELLGPSVPDFIEARFADGRLPGTLAKTIAKQALVGLDLLHDYKIAHGDLHSRNLAFVMAPMDTVSEHEFIKILGKPDIGHVHRTDGKNLGPGVPEYIVKPARTTSWPLPHTVKIIDFGESFLQHNFPPTLHTPLVVRAPEVIFHDRLDYRLFEIFVGQPPFDSLFTTPQILVGQMQEITNEMLPERWMGAWEAMRGGDTMEDSGPGLQEWLEKMYFDGERKADLAKEDIVKLGHIIQRLLRFEPSSRASVKEILNDPWFRD